MKNKLLLGSLVLASTVWGVEKVDPFRQVTTQWVRPNLLVVLDISGSMSWDMFGSGVGVDNRGGATGAADKPAWNLTSTTSGCSRPKKKYTYKLSFRFPSRMAMVKNVLGNSVTIWQPPNNWRTAAFWPNITGWTKSTTFGATNTVSYTSTCLATAPTLPSQLAAIAIPDPTPPADLVGQTADKVNWGLVVYSGRYSNCGKAELVAKIDTLDTGDVTTVENAMKLASAGGLPAMGGTPTRGALEFAKEVMSAVKNGGTVSDYSTAFGGQTFTFPADPKRGCGRSYSVLLVTDGQSNICNANSWYCWKDPATGRCDGQSGYTCPNSLSYFPAQRSKELWQNLGVRTFAVGVSEQIGPCELNHVAYEGKTDASSPNGDAGFNTDEDPRLANYAVNDSQLPSQTNPPYAFFTSSAQQFRSAIAQILAALGTGDYVTSAPSVTGTAEVAGIGLLGTVDYPQLRGHLLAYNVSDPNSFPLLWDAGAVLSSGNKGVSRNLYTWIPAANNQLIAITSANTATALALNALCGGCGITTQVVDFMLGNDGNGNPRSWQLGAILNSTPAVVGPPAKWKQATGLATARDAFQETYKDRHPLVWVGSSDGMLHAFDLSDGAEILAILPPDLLDKQVQLYNQFMVNPARFPTGQPQLPEDHIFGVANSMRFADVFFPQGLTGEFKTVLFLTEGPGGTGVHALDITHVYPGRTGVVLPDGSIKDYPPDPNYNANAPFTVLWGYTRDGEAGTARLANLRYTWGLPAVAMDENENFYLAMPSGYLSSDQSDPDPANSGKRFLFLKATDGSVVTNQTLLPASGNQYISYYYPFADVAFWQTTSKRFQPDNYADQAILGDLHGQLWALNSPFSSLTQLKTYKDANAKGSPLYYATAVAGYPMVNPKWAIYASISGNFYERDQQINPPPGWLSNPTLFHRSEIYLTALPTATGVSSCSQSLRLDTLKRSDDPNNFLSRRTQPTSYPLLLIPTEKSSLVNALALFSVYDPDAATCIGKTYLVIAEFNPQTCSLGATVFSGGAGASSGFVITPAGVLYAKSFVGEGGQASFQAVPVQPPQRGGEGGSVTWWREIQ